jgi:hypothetical protein
MTDKPSCHNQSWQDVYWSLVNKVVEIGIENAQLKARVSALSATLALEGERRRVLEDMTKGDAK